MIAVRSRVLLSIHESEDGELYGPLTPFSKDVFLGLFSDLQVSPADSPMEPELPHTQVLQDLLQEDMTEWPQVTMSANITASLPPLNATL